MESSSSAVNGIGAKIFPRNFVRGGETTSSVRLRRRKDEAQMGANGAAEKQSKKKNRHSGDFLYWSSSGTGVTPMTPSGPVTPGYHHPHLATRTRQPHFRQSGDWAMFAPGTQPHQLKEQQTQQQQQQQQQQPQSMVIGRNGLAYPKSALMEDGRNGGGLLSNGAISLPYHALLHGHGGRSRQQQQQRPHSQVNAKQLSDYESADANKSMETLDRKIPPSVRPALQPEKRYSSGFLLGGGADTKSDFVLMNTNNNNSSSSNKKSNKQNRRSCDFSSHYVPAGGANLLSSEHQMFSVEPVKLRPSSEVNVNMGRRAQTQADLNAAAAAARYDKQQQLASSSAANLLQSSAGSSSGASGQGSSNNSSSAKHEKKLFAKVSSQPNNHRASYEKYFAGIDREEQY